MHNTYTIIKQELEEHVDEHAHGDFSIDGLLQVMFGLDHVISEVFWNVVFVLVGFAVSKAVALRKIHKYIDDKHGVTHQKDEY
jgi:uncharacterized membrane protein YciS (DUF1049 family)